MNMNEVKSVLQHGILCQSLCLPLWDTIRLLIILENLSNDALRHLEICRSAQFLLILIYVDASELRNVHCPRQMSTSYCVFSQ